MVAVTIDQLSRDDLARQVGTAVRLHDRPDVALTLCEVTEREIAGEWETFSVHLRGSAESQLGQRTYELEHDELGTLELFIVPIEPDSAGARYEAVFNRARRHDGDPAGR
jgi:hypothetical protein